MLEFLYSASHKASIFTAGRSAQSDDEFLKDCGLSLPSDRADVALAVRRVVAKLGKVESQYIRATDRWPEELGILSFWDSIDYLHFVLSMELELKCKIVGGQRDLFLEGEPITVAFLARRVFELRAEEVWSVTNPIEVQRQRWEKLQGMGRWRFILLFGVITWGVPFALLFSLVTVLMGDHFLDTLKFIGPISLVGGAAFGAYAWRSWERKHIKASDGAGDTQSR